MDIISGSPMLPSLLTSVDDARGKIALRVEAGNRLLETIQAQMPNIWKPRTRDEAILDTLALKARPTIQSVQAEALNWNSHNALLLRSLLSTHELADSYAPQYFFIGEANANGWTTLKGSVTVKIASLIGIAERIHLYSAARESKTPAPTDQRVFVIHGHDRGAKSAVEAFLRRLQVQPIILERLPNLGRTVAEKLDAYADVHFVVTIMSPDDVGSLKGKELADRARQNVLLEYGYFSGRLGRNKVAVIRTGDLEEPSDTDGIVYIKMDDHEGWTLKLAKEMRAAGLVFDLAGLLK